MEKLETLLARAERMKWHAVHCLDLDQFKPVNDRFGHPMGDLLLKLVKDRFLACTREEDTVARLGGDEFGVLQQGLSRPEDAGKLASRLIEQIGVPYDLGGNEVKIGVSIGIALWPDNGLSVEELLHCADVALYRAKLEGRNGFRYS
jgi:diguanylate cyclase (GGDEF)-like protein